MSHQGRPSPHDRSSADEDPLVICSSDGFGAWLDRVGEISRRSWKSLILISTIGIALPWMIVSWTIDAMRVRAYLPPEVADGRSLISGLPPTAGSLCATLMVIVAAVYVIAVAWSAGIWIIVSCARSGSARSWRPRPRPARSCCTA